MGALLYLEPLGGLTAQALGEALAGLGRPLPTGTEVYCGPLPLASLSQLEPGLLVGLATRPGAGVVDREGLEALRALGPRFTAPPAMRILAAASGQGGGATLRAALGEPLEEGPSPEGLSEEPLLVLEANLDDLSPQLVEVILEGVFRAGALDAWTQPIIMKKGRPGLLLGVLCAEGVVPAVRDLLFRESTTLGVRASRVSRWALAREQVAVATEFGEVRVKLGRLRGELVNAHPEFEDCRARAQAAGVPVKRVFAAALAAFWAARRGDG